jgi:uncharacterized membrane protein
MASPVPPPPLPPSGPTGPTGSTNLGLAPNVGALLCYVPCCIGLIFSIVVAIVEKQSRYLRFHAFQSLLFHAGLIVLWVALTVLGFILGAVHLGLIMIPIQLLVGLAVLGLHILLMIKAYNNEQYELPTLGAMAKNWV